MNSSTKYMALDIHQATTVASVREQNGADHRLSGSDLAGGFRPE
jgi:hypothetical protein